MLTTTEETILREFSQACGDVGAIDRVKKLKDYAFVHFKERDQAIKALDKLNGMLCMVKNLKPLCLIYWSRTFKWKENRQCSICSESMNVQADLKLHCSYIAEGPFLAHMSSICSLWAILILIRPLYVIHQQHFACEHSRGHIFGPIFKNYVGMLTYIYESLDDFETGSCGVKK